MTTNITTQQQKLAVSEVQSIDVTEIVYDGFAERPSVVKKLGYI